MKHIGVGIIILCIALNFNACKSEGDESDPIKKEIVGVIRDKNDKVYPNTKVKISSALGETQTSTNEIGAYQFDISSDGIYQVSIIPPLTCMVVSEQTVTTEFKTTESKKIDFVIETQPLTALIVYDDIDIFGEVKNASGTLPIDPEELIYARNVFDPPIGQLTPIKSPTGHQLTLSEWQNAGGSILVDCNGYLTTVSISLTGLIPNGTYSFWLNFLNKKKTPGQSVSFANDVVKIEPLGSGSLNIATADGTGSIKKSVNHPVCILTNEVALVLVVDYHLNGKTFGSSHIPDDEDVNHMLIYFQE